MATSEELKAGDGIVNRVAASGIKVLDLEDYHVPGERVLLDISDQLFQGMILREKSFREFIKVHDWKSYQGKFVAVNCSTDAIIPMWAYMLLTSALSPYASLVVYGNLEDLEARIYFSVLSRINWAQFENAKVVIKGCSKVSVPAAAYVEATRMLRPFASSIMFGEPCSTVPVYKKSKG